MKHRTIAKYNLGDSIIYRTFVKLKTFDMSYVNALFHVVFSTSRRIKSIPAENAHELYKYIGGIAKTMKCSVLRIGGVDDHLHILMDLNPECSIADFVKEVKRVSSAWMRIRPIEYPGFQGWARGYFAGSVSFSHRDSVIEYIDNQREHHAEMATEIEFRNLLLRNGLNAHGF